MSRMLRGLTLFLVLASIAAGVGALELTKGRIKLVLHEELGRFSLYYMTDIRAQTYVPLFLVQDPRTSSLSILEANQAHRMGDSTAFTESTEQTVNGARFAWESGNLEVVQDFEFLTSISSNLADAVVVRLSITNLSEQSLSVGARYVFDTDLGEGANVHFTSPREDEFSREAELTPSANLWYWRSPSSEHEGVAFQQTLFGSGVTEPSRVLFANWKRLNESTWEYEVERRRNFNLLPYSINDSAAAIYYEPVTLASGATRQIIAIFGNRTDSGYVLRSSESGLSRVFQQVVTDSSPEASESAVRGDLIAVGDLIKQIDILLANPEELSRDDLEVLQGLIAELEGRRIRYE